MIVTFAPPQRCVRRMRPGMVKRSPVRGPLVGYTIACPTCGRIFIYLHDTHRFIEGPWIVTPTPLLDDRDEDDQDAPPQRMVDVRHPTGLGAERPIQCRCGHAITMRNGEIW